MELLTKQVFLEWFHKTQTANLGIALVCFSMFFFFSLLLFEYIYIFKPAVIDIWFSDIWQGWSSAYSIESVIMQINATLVKGKARVQFGANKVSEEASLQL